MTAAPVVVGKGAAVDGRTLTITFSGNLQASMLDFNAFTVRDGTNTDAVINAAVKSDRITLTLASAVSAGDTVTVGYSPVGSDRLIDVNGDAVPAFSNKAVTNDTQSAPSVTKNSRTFNGTWRMVGVSAYLTGSGKHDADYSNKIRTLATGHYLRHSHIKAWFSSPTDRGTMPGRRKT
ncbi:MAG: SwmB domain-containing protein [Bacilli bacterium]